ncbi:MAG TPA: hypothetical protein VLL52_15555 [Anaerolineae bacterium]|nr:hypothetical protein [Anaerolineae bacterium]
MIDIDQITYSAIITITLPNMPQPAKVVVRLAPYDQIPTDKGLRPLSQCTLADIQAYADSIENDISQEYQSIQFQDLANAPDAQVNITVLKETDEALTTDWQKYALILSTEEVAELVEDETATDEVLAEEEVTTELIAEAELTTKTASDENTESISSIPPPPVQPASTDGIILYDTEPVHTERDPSKPIKPRPPRPDNIRVAGRQQPPGSRTWAAVDILCDEPVFRACQDHALSSMRREVAGVLIGPPPEKQPDNRYLVHITDMIIAKHTRMQGASVTYTPESWRYLNDIMHERYPDESAVMVGWYHTHPGFGIFLSGMDLFIHKNFFTQLWHIALVLDPVGRTSGFFCWDRHQTRVSPYDFPWPYWAAHSW